MTLTWIVLALAVTGTALICFGSWTVARAPGDGQTGMVVYPLYLFGGALGIFAIIRASRQAVPGVVVGAIWLLAAISIASVVWGFVATMQYERERDRRRSSQTQTESPGPGEKVEEDGPDNGRGPQR